MKQKKSGAGRRVVCLVLAAVMLLGLISSALIIMVNAASSSEIKKELNGLRHSSAGLSRTLKPVFSPSMRGDASARRRSMR